MASGSTRSVFHLTFQRENNIADITAKGTSQYIFSSLFGTATGVTVCAYIGQCAVSGSSCFAMLAALSLYSSFKTVRSIPLPTLNNVRLQMLAEKYLKCASEVRSACWYPAYCLSKTMVLLRNTCLERRRVMIKANVSNHAMYVLASSCPHLDHFLSFILAKFKTYNGNDFH